MDTRTTSREPTVALEGVAGVSRIDERLVGAARNAWVQHRLNIICGLMVVLVLFAGWISTAHFLSLSNVLNIVRASATTGIAALGVAMITMSGNYFSLSVSATASLCGIVFAGASNALGGPVIGVLAALGAGALLGYMQGGLVGLGANPIITTLAFNGALFGVAAAVTGSQTVVVRSAAAVALGTSSPGGVPLPVIIFVVLILLGSLFLNRTTLGRCLMLVGSNRRTAAAVGLSVFAAATAAFTVSGVTAAVVGVLSAAQAGVGEVGQITTLDLATVAAVLIGGTHVQGGEGSLVRTALGAIFVSALASLLIVGGYSYGVQVCAQGVAVVIAVSVFWLMMRTDR